MYALANENGGSGSFVSKNDDATFEPGGLAAEWRAHRTPALDDTRGAGGVARPADGTAVGDEVQVKIQVGAPGDKRTEKNLGFLDPHARGKDQKAGKDAVNVGIHGEDVSTEGEEQNAAGGLRANAVVGEEGIEGVVVGELVEVVQRQRGTFALN